MNLKDLAYRTVDTLTGHSGVERTVGGERIRFPLRFSRYFPADYEPETFKFLRENLKPGDTFLDIGAHIGLFSVVGARLVSPGGKVVSFEPTPYTRGVLKEMVELNGNSDVIEIRAEAVSAARGKTTFYDTGEEISNANSLVHIDRGRSGIEVDLISIDELVADEGLKPTCIKIDVEGAELDLLRGARKTFSEIRPVARLGLHPPQINQNGQDLSDIWDILSEYKLVAYFDGTRVNRQWFCEQRQLFDVSIFPA